MKFYGASLSVIFLCFLSFFLFKQIHYGWLLSFLIAAVAALLFSLFFTRRLAKPLKNLTEAVSRMTSGDFQVRVSWQERNELTSLSQGLNLLAEKSSQLIAKISEEKNQLRVILDSMVEGVMVIDSRERLLLTNPAVRRIFELEMTPEGHTPLALIRSTDLQALVKEVLLKKNSVEREIQIHKENVKHIRVQASPLLDGIEGSVLVFYDVTSLRRLENIRKDFVANVSHELKTPLAAIKGYTETLLGGALHDEANATRFLQVIDHHADRLSHLIQDLLDLSKIESAQYELQPEKISLPLLLEELKSTFQKEMEDKQIELKVEDSEPPFVWADPIALRQILSNLLDNAIKYSSSSATIFFRVEKLEPKNVLQFCVQDTGTGIAAAHLPRIFERFYRVDASRSRELGGTGLGLSIVKHWVQLHGGEVWAESELGKGSRFYFTLPSFGISSNGLHD